METDNHILIAGGSGLIGSHLIQLLLERGYQVSVLSRRQKTIPNVKVFRWDVEHGYLDINALKNLTAIINLSGQNIADKPWTEVRKKELRNSRVRSTQLLYKTLANTSHTVATFINASAIGIYRQGNEWLEESSEKGDDFLAQICKEWEHEAEKIQALNIRTVIFRFGHVLSVHGGMLREMLFPIKLFVAPVFGKGSQWQSWIHINDLCRMMIYTIDNKNISGTYNAVAPEPVSNINLVRAMQACVKNVSFKIHIPVFLLRLFLGERVALLTASHRVSGKKITEAGFSFRFANSVTASIDCVRQNH